MTTKPTITAALATPDEHMGIYNRTRPDSLPSRLEVLKTGEMASKVATANSYKNNTDRSRYTAEEREKMRNNVGTAVTRTKDKFPGREFSIEVTHVLMPSGQVYTLAVITRTK